jgi:hypothetical protein
LFPALNEVVGEGVATEPTLREFVIAETNEMAVKLRGGIVMRTVFDPFHEGLSESLESRRKATSRRRHLRREFRVNTLKHALSPGARAARVRLLSQGCRKPSGALIELNAELGVNASGGASLGSGPECA